MSYKQVSPSGVPGEGTTCAAFQCEKMCCLWPRSVVHSYWDLGDKEPAPERRNGEDGQVCNMDVQVCVDVGVCKVCMCVSVCMCILGAREQPQVSSLRPHLRFLVRQSLRLPGPLSER